MSIANVTVSWRTHVRLCAFTNVHVDAVLIKIRNKIISWISVRSNVCVALRTCELFYVYLSVYCI